MADETEGVLRGLPGGTHAWGPALWEAIHLIALGFPGGDAADRYARFYRSLGGVIPCPKCAANYERHLRELPPVEHAAAAGRAELFAWTVALHNEVSRDLGKRRSAFTLEDAAAALRRAAAARRGGWAAPAAAGVVMGAVAALVVCAALLAASGGPKRVLGGGASA